MNKINTKTIARIAAVQALYQYDINYKEQSVDELINNISTYYKDDEMKDDLELSLSLKGKFKINSTLFFNLVKFAIEDEAAIHDIISRNLGDGWKWENMHITINALLMAAVCELKYFPETPYKVVINEFTDIASDMLKDNEVAFVNSILDKIHKELNV